MSKTSKKSESLFGRAENLQNRLLLEAEKTMKFKKGDYIRCIDNSLNNNILTIGKLYVVSEYVSFSFSRRDVFFDMISVMCDDNIKHNFYCDRFELDVKEMRKEKLKRIGL